ncbi:tRNA uridine-5-carboxymethylaminomethyl(34) synthesis GTPase MnmE [Alkalicella caledoniensis]|uniref:tRNA modification GTPase MnmE n=1 Tax=Alkalicella caledoniensis TaxID=2731377 RepID=A0A7G9W8J3_ALKCA|nr:tRNA uridine-5-carboxymethylaminomethyl(34) synthesis GTPase MnmE [Alkalicella caledoniensis]QNO15005.1 tRNA uridine-5-carboxymethylaminomethyl(34) synthesis GTPase MnmE [Alkalicella caledoniensis]
MIDDTIVAVATAVGKSGVGIVRVSGKSAIHIVNKVFRSSSGKSLLDLRSNTINYGFVERENKIIDEVLVSLFRGPKSYTGEDVVEINCHGGPIPIKLTMELLLTFDCRLAEPGEFTRRAFLNGRIDLSQAEGIMDIISAKTDLSLDAATKQVLGKLSSMINELNESIISSLALIEATIDYPDEVFESIDVDTISNSLNDVINELNNLLLTAKTGKILRDGIKTTIVGKPNVGKSSLLNSLLEQQRAIVTDIPGTTRDILEEQISINGVPLVLVDTAGIRETDDVVERIGVERSKSAINESNLVLFVLDGSKEWEEYDQKILELIKGKKVIILINKLDLPQMMDINIIANKTGVENIINVSIEKNINLEELKNEIFSMYEISDIEDQTMNTMITNLRHEKAIKDAVKNLMEAIENIEAGMPLDIVAIDIKDAWENLGKVSGSSLNKNIVDEIFSRFCLGK